MHSDTSGAAHSAYRPWAPVYVPARCDLICLPPIDDRFLALLAYFLPMPYISAP